MRSLALLAVVVCSGLLLLRDGDAHTSTQVLVTGVVIEDRNGNNTRDAGDTGTKTLVELHRKVGGQYGPGGASCFTDDSGRFEFRNLTTGDYELHVWWGPGFITPAKDGGTALINPFNVDAASAASGEMRSYEFFVKEKPANSIPWPVRTSYDSPPPGVCPVAIPINSTPEPAHQPAAQSQATAGPIRGPSTGDGNLLVRNDAVPPALIALGSLARGLEPYPCAPATAYAVT